MKRVHLMSLYMALTFIVPFNVYALTGNVNISCPESVLNTSSNIVCNIKGTSDDIVMGLSFKVSISGGGSVASFTKTTNIWHDASYTDGKVQAYAEEINISGDFEVGNLNLKLPENSLGTITVTISDVVFGDKDYNDITTGITGSKSNIKITKKEEKQETTSVTPKPSVDNKENEKNDEIEKGDNDDGDKPYLENIIIDGYQLNFNKDVYDYVLKINDETSLSISPVLETEKAEYLITGNNNLANGSVISIKVSLDDKETTYTIKIIKDNVTSKKENINYYKIAFLVIISVLILINIFRILHRRRKNKIWKKY